MYVCKVYSNGNRQVAICIDLKVSRCSSMLLCLVTSYYEQRAGRCLIHVSLRGKSFWLISFIVQTNCFVRLLQIFSSLCTKNLGGRHLHSNDLREQITLSPSTLSMGANHSFLPCQLILMSGHSSGIGLSSVSIMPRRRNSFIILRNVSAWFCVIRLASYKRKAGCLSPLSAKRISPIVGDESGGTMDAFVYFSGDRRLLGINTFTHHQLS